MLKTFVEGWSMLVVRHGFWIAEYDLNGWIYQGCSRVEVGEGIDSFLCFGKTWFRQLDAWQYSCSSCLYFCLRSDLRPTLRLHLYTSVLSIGDFQSRCAVLSKPRSSAGVLSVFFDCSAAEVVVRDKIHVAVVSAFSVGVLHISYKVLELFTLFLQLRME